MARLVVKAVGLENKVIELKLGSNVIGRSPDCDFQISHPTVSTMHCELLLNEGGVRVRDLESTNGSFLDGAAFREAYLQPGQMLRLGDIELLVENIDCHVAIPKFANTELPAPPVVSREGEMLCPRHPFSAVTFQCTACKEVMCGTCVHRLRRKGSKNVLLLCSICSHAVKLIGQADKPKKRGLFARVGETVKLKLTRTMNVDK